MSPIVQNNPNADQRAVWRSLSQTCIDILEESGPNEVMAGIRYLGLDSCEIPTMEDMNYRLTKVGWTVTPIKGFVSAKIFLHSLANSVLPIATDLRGWNEIEFSAEPDFFHEAFGHLALLGIPIVSEFLKRIGILSKMCFSYDWDELYLHELTILIEKRKNLEIEDGPQIKVFNKEDVSELVQLVRLAWWTYETGLILQNGKIKPWGAALTSSARELRSYLTRTTLPLSLECINQHFDPSTMQPQYYYINSFSDLSSVLNDFEAQLAANKGGAEGCFKALKSRAPCQITLSNGSVVFGIVREVGIDTVGIRLLANEELGVVIDLPFNEVVRIVPHQVEGI